MSSLVSLFSNNVYEQRRAPPALGRYRPSNSSGGVGGGSHLHHQRIKSSAELRSTASTSSLVSSHSVAANGGPKRKMLRHRADTVGAGLGKSASPRLSPCADGALTHNNSAASSNGGLKFPFETWFEVREAVLLAGLCRPQHLQARIFFSHDMSRGATHGS